MDFYQIVKDPRGGDSEASSVMPLIITNIRLGWKYLSKVTNIYELVLIKEHLKNVNNCLKANIYSTLAVKVIIHI
jgi:hypothetical protein